MAELSPSTREALVAIYSQPLTWVAIIGGLATAYASTFFVGVLITAAIGAYSSKKGIDELYEST